MAGQDYVPLYLPGHEVTCTAAAAITAGQLVYVSAGTVGGNPSVSPTSAATAAQCGVAAQTVASGQQVDVWFGGVHVLAASGAIAAGVPVVAAASGAVADGSADTTYSQIVGKAWSAASNSQVVVKLI
jgi:predicted RecA/RadA family phage recombinase